MLMASNRRGAAAARATVLHLCIHRLSRRGMRILTLADSAIPVPPITYGGTERILSFLIDGLSRKGHEVTLIGKEGSRVPGRLVTFDDARDKPRFMRGIAKAKYWRLLGKELDRHDVIHSAARLDYVRPALSSDKPKVLHFENPITDEHVRFVRKHQAGRVVMAPAGYNMMRNVRDDGVWRPVHNAIPVERFEFSPQPADPPYLAFLGRLTMAKGVDDAIDAALEAGLPLKIAGTVPDLHEERAFFMERIGPRLGSNGIEYIGEQDDEQKQHLLGGALALLNPIKWEEPFGIVAIEALACGTPVISYARGELPNIVRDGETGFLCSEVGGMVAAIAKVGDLARARCREDAEKRFDVDVMVDNFEEIYEWLLGGSTELPAHWAEGTAR